MSYFWRHIYFGFLAFTCVEILAGSSPLWIISPWAWFVTIPLYTVHFLFFISIAIKFKRTGLRELYLFGILLGLYESWITKVIWSGYGHDGNFTLGSILGLGIQETTLLTLFWHPLLAFLFPLVIIHLYLYEVKSSQLFPDVFWLTSSDIKAKIIRFSILFFGIMILAANSGGPIVVLLTSLPNLVILYIGKKILFDKDNQEIQEDELNDTLELKGLSFIIVTFLMVLYYVLGYFFLDSKNIPGIVPIIVVILYYFLVILLIKVHISEPFQISNEVDIQWLKWYFLLIALSTLATFILPIIVIVFIGIILIQVPYAIYVAYTFIFSKLQIKHDVHQNSIV